jgi:tetratricopeptide (TPR) repeat protein
MIDSFVMGLSNALVLAAQGDCRGAEALCRDMAERLPSHGNTLCANAVAAYLSNSIEGLKQSLALFEQAIAADPDNLNSQGNYAVALQRMGRHAEARRVNQLLSSGPVASRFLALDDVIQQLKADNPVGAEGAMRALRDGLPMQAAAWNTLGYQAAMSGQFLEAVPLFRRAVADQPEEVQFHENLAIALVAVGELPAAHEVREAIRKGPYLTTPARVVEDLAIWAAASGYETRTINQPVFTAPARLDKFPKLFRDMAAMLTACSEKPGIVVKAQGLKVIYWRWHPPAEGPDGSHIMIPLSSNNDLLVSPDFLYAYPFLRDLSADATRCNVHASAFITARLRIAEECFFLGGIPEFSDWLAGDFPKLQALKGADLPDGIPIYTVGLKAWMRETLAAIDLSNRVRELASPHPLPSCTLLEFDQAWLAGGFSMQSNFEFMRQSFFRHAALLPGVARGQPVKRIYLRSPPDLHGSNRISNEAEVCSYLVQIGFEIVYPEKLNIQEKAELFGTATVVFSGPGSRCFNFFAFAHPACTLVMPIAKGLLDRASTGDNWPLWNLPYLDQTVFVTGSLLASPPADKVELFNASAHYAIADIAAAVEEAAQLASLYCGC